VASTQLKSQDKRRRRRNKVMRAITLKAQVCRPSFDFCSWQEAGGTHFLVIAKEALKEEGGQHRGIDESRSCFYRSLGENGYINYYKR
jgi:hypothetical protein